MNVKENFYAYIHARPTTVDANGVFYIGKGKGDRYKDFSHRTFYHKNIVNKYGKENLLIGKIYCSSEQIAKDLEIGLIKCFKRMQVKLANFTDGGEGLSGYKHREETKRKQSISRLGRKISLETKEKLRLANLGKPGTFLGKKHSEETKRKISLLKLGKPNPSARRKMEQWVKDKISKVKMNRPIASCPWCGLTKRHSNAMKRYHFDNCKMKEKGNASLS
jgi:hypothetical protein